MSDKGIVAISKNPGEITLKALQPEIIRLCPTMAIYNDFVAGYECGESMVEIAKRNHVSERMMYRYKTQYDKIREAMEKQIL